jgi:threonylcarbamoyladenosine tRNA methylthiotransferase MtaB
MGSWGRDLSGDMDFGMLLHRLSELPGTFRIRLSSIYPMDITESVFDLVTTHPKLSRHLHLPLQSGSTSVLRKMGRHVSPAEFLDLTWRLRDTAGRFGIGGDVIAGFPGERETDFQATRKLIEDSAITYLHVFPFSPRDGTKAAELPDQLNPEIIKERARVLRALGNRKREEFRAALTGPVEILVERRRDSETGLLTGFTSDYLRAHFDGPDEWMGKLVRFDKMPGD